MLRKIVLGMGAAGVSLAMLPLLAAFEAHVVNVTARIENALNVPVREITFGTVFPQEKLDQFFNVSLSQSFQEADRVDDVDYFIRQKPKCGLPIPNTDPVEYSAFGQVTEGIVEEEKEFYCKDDGYVLLPLLCPYLSKHEVSEDGTAPNGENDEQPGISAFHGPITVEDWTLNVAKEWDVQGHLAKAQNDLSDRWNIDLKVPCFGGNCAQDWAQFVADNDGNNDADPDAYIQPIENEHELFGCDLWLEVSGFSLPGLGCQGKIDLMLVVDESGSIGSTNMALVKTALHSFIDAMILATDGPNAGQTSFAFGGALDQQLTSNPALMHAAIDTLSSGGTTNLTAGIDLAQIEFDSVRDRADAPNIMLVITDGVPNVCIDGSCSPGEAEAEAAAEAAAAQLDGTEIFVVGVGTGINATYLTDEIANSAPPTHYFAGDFDTLETTILDLISCEAD